MRKIRIDDCICHSKIEGHKTLKNNLLDKINTTPCTKLLINDSYYKDSITRLDFDYGSDMNRPWIKEFLPHFTTALHKITEEMGYIGLDLDNMWFQQYYKEDTHGWHIHGRHFTGVYYLEYPRRSGKTEICSPYSMRPQCINASEGDLIIFPAHWIHRARPNKTERKTIISFNFDAAIQSLRINKIR